MKLQHRDHAPESTHGPVLTETDELFGIRWRSRVMSRNDDKDEEREERIRQLMERAQKQMRNKTPAGDPHAPAGKPASTKKKKKRKR
jgi:hypothetical protein